MRFRLQALILAIILVAPAANAAVEVFVSGSDGYHTYRIPALVRTAAGTLIAMCEGRRHGASDAGNIDLVLKRSIDGGNTWGPLEQVWDDGVHTCGNPCLVVPQGSGTVCLLCTWNRGDDHEQEIINRTSGDTRRVYLLKSSNDGQSWSVPREITADVKRDTWTWYATGPGSGIELRQGVHQGRLVVPCDHIEAGTKRYYSHVIVSDDGGDSWIIGGISPRDEVNECQLAELGDGRLVLNMRNYNAARRVRQLADSCDGGATWIDQRFEEQLIEPICQAACEFVPNAAGKGGTLVFSNPANRHGRVNLTVRASRDAGLTWATVAVLHGGPSAYSDLEQLDAKSIGCLYESGDRQPYETIRFARVSVAEGE